MDPHSSFQDVARCDVCETAIVHSYCDFCHVNLCKPCIGEHISDGYDKHKIVPFQKRRSTLIYPKCGTHQHKNCELQCKDCNIFVCSTCTASTQHKGHNFEEVTEVYKTQKEIIKKDTQELENNITPTYEEIALYLEKQLANLDGGYEKLTTTISKQGEQWHREIDIIINKMKFEIGEIKVKHRGILKKHLDEIKQIQSLITQTFLALRKIEMSTDISPTIEYRSKIREFRKLPPTVHVSLPTFIPKPIDREKLYCLFGQITTLSTATEESVLSLNQPKPTFRELLDEPEFVATIQTGHKKLRSVSCLNEDMIWTSGLTKEIKCFNIKGVLLQTIKQTSGIFPNDIALYSDGDLLYVNRAARKIIKVKNRQTEVLITLQGWVPSKLCVTSTSDILVVMQSNDESQSKVVRYSGSTEKQTIQYDKEGKPLYSANMKIKYITENRNHDICVADCGAGAVVVVNQDGKFKWRYTGHSSVTKIKPFEPCGITTDSQCRILTSDSDNHCIHILDQNGQFLRYIDNCDLEYPWGLCVDNDDNLFVCEDEKGIVKKIIYLRIPFYNPASCTTELNSVSEKRNKAAANNEQTSAKLSETIDQPTAVVEIQYPHKPTGAPQQSINDLQAQYELRGVNPLLRAPLPRINIANIRQRNGMILRMPVIHVTTRNFRNQLVRRTVPIYTIRDGKVFFSTTIRQRYPQVIARVRQLEAQGVALKPTYVRPDSGSLRIPPTPFGIAAARRQQQAPVVDRMTETTDNLAGTVEAGENGVVVPGADPIPDTIYPAEKKLKNMEAVPLTTPTNPPPMVETTSYQPTTESAPVPKEKKEQKKEPNMNEFPFVLTTRGGNTPIDALTGLPLNQPIPDNFVLPTFEPPTDLPPPPSDLLRKGMDGVQ